MLRITLLLSGSLGLTLLKKLYVDSELKIVSVLTDFNSEEISVYCNQNNINLFKGNPRKKKDELNLFLSNIGISDIIFSINYLFIIEKDLINYPLLYALNIHGSLLPKYRGRTPHVWSIINGENITGVSVHKIEEGVDTGGVLLQKSVVIENEDTGALILEKYNSIYPLLVDEAIKLLRDKKDKFKEQEHSKATFFGKRTPDDGKIDWNWSKERIRNWVRAQANPYPGAFTFIDGTKLIIDKVSYSDYGFSFSTKNGTILKNIPFLVKTPNGTIEIEEYKLENEKSFKFNEGLILGL